MNENKSNQEDLKDIVAANLVRLRQSANLTQLQLAEKPRCRRLGVFDVVLVLDIQGKGPGVPHLKSFILRLIREKYLPDFLLLFF